MTDSRLESPTRPTCYFIGVTTRQSSSRKIFPRWMEVLGRPNVQLVGIDIEIHANPDVYRQVVSHIKHEPLALGGLVTTHKIDLMAAAHDLFDELGHYAVLTKEISSISKDGGRLVGQTTDPNAGGLSLDAILGENYFGRTGGEVLILGSGGAATALSLHLLEKSNPGDHPAHVLVVDLLADRLARLKEMTAEFDTDIQFEFIQSERARQNDEIMASLASGSVVINATGMGKDTPGSPITPEGLFPMNGAVWELNYRGKRDFLQQALAQKSGRNLTVEDGWSYFIHGWSQVIANVLRLQIDDDQLDKLSQIAVEFR